MILGDSEIRQRVTQSNLVQPFSETNLQPASYDITLAGPYLFPRPGQEVRFERDLPDYVQRSGHLILSSGSFALASTLERVSMPLDLSAQVDGRSSLGRLGVAVHITAGWLDPGFCGRITLEISNHGPQRVVIPCGSRIGQLIFFSVLGCTAGYTGKYQGQTETTGTRVGGGK